MTHLEETQAVLIQKFRRVIGGARTRNPVREVASRATASSSSATTALVRAGWDSGIHSKVSSGLRFPQFYKLIPKYVSINDALLA